MIEKTLLTFLTMVEEQSTLRCAEKLHLTQPAVTQHLHSLEQELQTKLFFKQGRKLVLTDKGKEFYQLSRQLYAVEQQILLQMQACPASPLRFGVTHSINEGIMPLIAADFMNTFSQRPIEMAVQNTSELLQRLENGSIHFALIEGNIFRQNYTCIPFFQSDFIGLCKTNGKYSHIKTLPDAFSAPLLVREQGSGSADILQNALAACGYFLSDFKSIHRFESIPVLLELVRQDFGITFAHREAAAKLLSCGEISVLPASVLHIPRTFWFVFLSGSPFSVEMQQIFSFFHQAIHQSFLKQ